MPRNTNIKQMQKESAASQRQLTPALPQSGRKAPGTRVGTLRDWREGSTRSGKTSAGIGKTLRDGR
jgi:hypothetical protein